MSPDTDRWIDIIRSASSTHGVPVGLLRGMLLQESQGDPLARRAEPHIADESRGLMQILVSTARDYGEDDPEALWDPSTNVHLGARIVSELYGNYWEIPEGPGSVERWRFAVAAYNCGRGNLNKSLLRCRRALGFADSPADARPGLWQRWEFVIPFLPGRTSRFTPNHVEKVFRNWAFWEAFH